MADPCLAPTPRISLALDASGALVADIVPSADDGNGVELRNDGLWTPDRPGVVGTLPASPFDGQEQYAQPQPSRLWHVRYDASLSAPDRWVMLGGTSMITQAEGTDSFTADGGASWHNVGDAAPLTVPYGGVYMLAFGGEINSDATSIANGSAKIGVSRNGNDPVDDYTVTVITHDSLWQVGSREIPINGTFAAGDVLTINAHAAASTGNVVVRKRWIRLTPVRIRS
jgi:hypothetical protein